MTRRKVAALTQELRECADLIQYHHWAHNALTRLIEAVGELADWSEEFTGKHSSRDSDHYIITEHYKGCNDDRHIPG